MILYRLKFKDRFKINKTGQSHCFLSFFIPLNELKKAKSEKMRVLKEELMG